MGVLSTHSSKVRERRQRALNEQDVFHCKQTHVYSLNEQTCGMFEEDSRALHLFSTISHIFDTPTGQLVSSFAFSLLRAVRQLGLESERQYATDQKPTSSRPHDSLFASTLAKSNAGGLGQQA